MTAHSIDIGALARRAGHTLFTDGPEQPAATARETCVLLDLLAAAEAERDEWRQTALDERGATLDALEQIKAREARVKAAQEEAWEECAAMAAHHGAFDGSRARWLSSINPYSITEKENA